MKRLMLICLMFTTGLAFCQDKAAKVALAKVAALPEVKAFLRTAKSSQPNLMLNGEPNKDSEYYWIKVGLGNLGIFRTWSDFLVDLKTQQIFYLDVFTDSGTKKLTLNQWRKWRKLPAWKQLHCYTGKGEAMIFKSCNL